MQLWVQLWKRVVTQVNIYWYEQVSLSILCQMGALNDRDSSQMISWSLQNQLKAKHISSHGCLYISEACMFYANAIFWTLLNVVSLFFLPAFEDALDTAKRVGHLRLRGELRWHPGPVPMPSAHRSQRQIHLCLARILRTPHAPGQSSRRWVTE